jgi:putative polyhydroxyalkanoate system protein
MSREAVKRQAEELADTLKEKLGAEYFWQDDTLHFSRNNAKGYIQVSDDLVDIEVTLGLVLRPMRGVVENLVSDYLDKHLA